MAILSDFLENQLIDGVFRGGALNAAGAVNSTAVVTGVWTASTGYTLGQVVVPHANMTGAGGKFLICTTAGTTDTNNALAVPAVGSTLADGTVVWTAISGIPSLRTQYLALFTAAPSDTGGGTEVTGGSYARAAVTCSLTTFAGTQGAGTTATSSGTGGATSNNAAIAFAAATADWGTVTHVGSFDALTGGRLLWWMPLGVAREILDDDVFQFNVAALAITAD
jgi:hypothetical protein